MVQTELLVPQRSKTTLTPSPPDLFYPFSSKFFPPNLLSPFSKPPFPLLQASLERGLEKGFPFKGCPSKRSNCALQNPTAPCSKVLAPFLPEGSFATPAAFQQHQHLQNKREKLKNKDKNQGAALGVASRATAMFHTPLLRERRRPGHKSLFFLTFYPLFIPIFSTPSFLRAPRRCST